MTSRISSTTSVRAATTTTTSTLAAAITTSRLASSSSSLIASSSSSVGSSLTTSRTLSSSSAKGNSTWAIVTATVAQVVPSSSGSNSTTSSSSKSFPPAAIAVIAIVGGLVFLFCAYKLYAYLYRRFRSSEPDYPLPRPPLNGPGSSSGMPNSPSWATPRMGQLRTTSTMSMAFNNPSEMSWGNHSSSSSYIHSTEKDLKDKELFPPSSPEDNNSTFGHSYPATPVGPPSPLLPPQPIKDPIEFRRSQSSSSKSSLANSTHNTISSPTTARRSYMGAYQGPQLLRSPASSNRLSGAPHSPHSRVDIVPPQPLAPPPGSVVATDSTTLDFTPSSGVNGRGDDPWFGRSASGQAFNGHAFPPSGHSQSNSFSSGSSPFSGKGRDPRSSLPSRMSHNGLGDRDSYASGSGSRLADLSRPPSTLTSSSSTSSSPISSTAGYPFPYSLPPNATSAAVVSPLDNLQHRLAPVINAGGSRSTPGTRSSSSSGGARSNEDSSVGKYVAPREQLEELISGGALP